MISVLFTTILQCLVFPVLFSILLLVGCRDQASAKQQPSTPSERTDKQKEEESSSVDRPPVPVQGQPPSQGNESESARIVPRPTQDKPIDKPEKVDARPEKCAERPDPAGDKEQTCLSDDKSVARVNTARSKEGSNFDTRTTTEASCRTAADQNTQEIFVPVGANKIRSDRKGILCKAGNNNQKTNRFVSFKNVTGGEPKPPQNVSA